MSAVLAFLIAMMVTMSLMPMLMRVAGRLGLVDMPAARKVHATPIPRIGGVAMAVGVLVAVVLAGEADRFGLAFLAAAGTLLVFGVLDDRFDLHYRLKFLGQILAIAIVVAGGGLLVGGLTFTQRIDLPLWVAVPLTGFFLLGVTNAINLADGLDGLAGGTTFLCLGALGLLAHSDGLISLTVVALATAGAVLGFLRYNTFPARVFMGDAGSQLLGFTVGVLGIAVTQDASTIYSTALPVLLAGIPILDTLSVMVQRRLERRSMFGADRNHLHHKLLALGFDQRESVTLIYAAQIVLFVAAYLLRFESDLLVVGTYLAFCAVVIAALQWSQRRGWRFRSAPGNTAVTPLSRLIERLGSPKVLPVWSGLGLGLAVGGYALVVLLQSGPLRPDLVRVAGLLMLACFAALGWRRGRELLAAEKAGLYMVVALLAYLDTSLGEQQRWIPLLDRALPLLMAVITAARLRLAAERRFELTPLDLLVLFAALVVPSLPGLLELPAGTPLGIAKIVVLFYSVEVLADSGLRAALALRIAGSAALAWVVVRAW